MLVGAANHYRGRSGELAQQFQRDHGRPPTPVEMLRLAQQATLETRSAKHEPAVCQSSEPVGAMRRPRFSVALRRWMPWCMPRFTANKISPIIDADWIAAAADRILTAMEEHRSTWQVWHVQAEAQRQIRAANLTTDRPDQLVDLLVAEVLNNRSMPLTSSDDGTVEPAALRRSDGSSVYTVAGAELFTSARILDAERRLVATAGRTDGAPSMVAVDLALLESAANGAALDAGRPLLSDPWPPGCPAAAAIAPAAPAVKRPRLRPHTGLAGGGGSAAPLAQLLRSWTITPVPSDTLAKLTWTLQYLNGDPPEWVSVSAPRRWC